MAGRAAGEYEIRLPHPVTGAEVLGVDLDDPLPSALRQRLDRLLSERGVLVFRDQSLDPRGFARAIATFGALMPQRAPPFDGLDGPALGYVSGVEVARPAMAVELYTDHSNRTAPPRATALYGAQIPRRGGDMRFIHAQAAYDALPEAAKALLADARALHAPPGQPLLRLLPSADQQAALPETVQPLVVRHPATGRAGLFLDTARMEGIIGLPRRESDAIMALLMAHATDERFEYRHHWRAGDVVLWDNRTVLHRADDDLPEGEQRFLWRVMVEGTPLYQAP